ncbi:MATE family efflux transporter [Paraclostridium bifermentans]|uniref:MATE family efflux transporter n=1 Tax=Paraclostridium bifermentans TaxID=1490 RepID=UPI001C1248B8|nr:MATE family efflux transporter [Paraclostridium bifermentans]MBS5954728.1 MATE family efflux transporter [Paraclostridium bifermentans]MBU5288744.1 MATE family efflux transporter [Paraclostridium bifermentans]
MDNSKNILGTESIGRLLLKYSVPAIIGMMVNALYNVVDRVFIGNIPGVGPLAITGLGITMPIMSIIIAFGTLIGVGATTNVSLKLGQGDRNKAEQIVGNAVSLSVLIGILIAIFGTIFSNKMLMVFGASQSTIGYAKDYMGIILIGAIFNIMSMMFSNLIRGDGNPKLSAAIMAAGCFMNIVLDAIFIFGFNMGIQGAALATIISQAVSTIWGLTYYLRGKSNVEFKKINLKLDKTIIKTIFAIGMSPFAMQLANSMVQLMFNTSLKVYGGDLAIGAMATISSINMLFVMPAFGFVQGMQPIVGFNYGAKKYDRAKKTLKISLMLATVVFIVGALVIQIAPQLLVGAFNKDQELMNITVNGLRKYAFAMPIVGISIVGSNFIQSIGKAKMSMLLGLLRQVIVLIPMIMILPNFIGLNGIWLAQPTADIVSAIITGIVLVKEIKKYDLDEEVECIEELEVV